MQSLINSGCRIFNQSKYDGGTALHRAAEIGALECAQILIDNNADPNATDFNGETSFHTAAIYN